MMDEVRQHELKNEVSELRKAFAALNAQYDDMYVLLWMVLKKIGGHIRFTEADFENMPYRDHMVISKWKDLHVMETVIEAEVSRSGQWPRS